jgi:hypothetical protein
MKIRIRTATAAVSALVVLTVFAPIATADVNDDFSIRLPDGFSEFAKSAQNSKSPDGTIETTNYISKAPTGEAVVVTVSKMPGKILDPAKLMTSTRESLLKSLKATLETEEDIPGKLPSRRLMFHSDAVFLRSRLVVDADRFYQLLYVGRTSEQRSVPAVAALFDSFTIHTPAPMEQGSVGSN